MSILKEAWGRFALTFIIFVGGLLGWVILTLVFIAVMFLVVPGFWVATMIAILLKGWPLLTE